MLARFCPRFDVPNARIDDSGTTLDIFGAPIELAWPSGVTPYDVLGKLVELDPGQTWAVWEKQPNGKWRTEWRAYDLDVRYELTVDDGFSESGTANRLVKVFSAGVDENDRYAVNSEDDPDATLAARGINPSNTYDRLSTAALDDILDASKIAASTSQVTVARKVFDHKTGRWVEPFEILPGYLARVSGVSPRPNTLNENQPEGAAVFRVVSNDYSASSASSRLELNTFTVDERRAVANLMAAQRRG